MADAPELKFLQWRKSNLQSTLRPIYEGYFAHLFTVSTSNVRGVRIGFVLGGVPKPNTVSAVSDVSNCQTRDSYAQTLARIAQFALNSGKNELAR